MELLKHIRERKFDEEKSFKIYGEHLLERLKESHPNLPMVSKFKRPIPVEPGECDLYFTIKKGSSLFHKLNPFSKKLAVMYDPCGHSWTDRHVLVVESSLRDDISRIVSELNQESGYDFKIAYA
jgi:hypothetical protein